MNRIMRAEWMFLGGVVLIASVLSLCNLGNHYLWQDEAQTALISRTVLTHGIPMGYDGRNYFSQESGAEYDPEYRWRWHTWLPFYLLAGFLPSWGRALSWRGCRLRLQEWPRSRPRTVWHGRSGRIGGRRVRRRSC